MFCTYLIHIMKIKTLLATTLAAVLVTFGQTSFAKEKSAKANPDAMFVKKAADGGMTEVELGKVADKNGEKQEVKDFGKQMVEDHGKANDNLKTVAGKLNLPVPEKVSPKHQAKIDKMSKMSGAAFDKAYVQDMIKDHEMDIAEFEAADKEVKDADLKKFIEETIPVMKHHLEMVKKIEIAK